MVDPALFTSKSSEYGTPAWVFDPLNKRFHFTLDAAASGLNFKVPRYCTTSGLYVQHFSTPYKLASTDGLMTSWANERVFLNPPYGRGITAWVRKCALETAEVVVAMLPARTDTEWFHRWVYPYAALHFVMGRIQFIGGRHSAPFPSIVAVYNVGGAGYAYAVDLRDADVFDGHENFVPKLSPKGLTTRKLVRQ